MYEKLLLELTEMGERNAEFTEYFHKIFEIIDNTEGNQRALLMYKLILDVRSLGNYEGRNEIKENIKGFLDSKYFLIR